MKAHFVNLNMKLTKCQVFYSINKLRNSLFRIRYLFHHMKTNRETLKRYYHWVIQVSSIKIQPIRSVS